MTKNVSDFLRHNFRHFNAAVLVDAADAYRKHIENGGKMMITLAGAMSTAELGISLAEMIRQKKVHAISCTGANLEEDLFLLIGRDKYERIANYRDLTPADEQKLFERSMARVTDTAFPEDEISTYLGAALLAEWQAAERAGERLFPHEFFYRVLRSGRLDNQFQSEPRDSWLVAAMEHDLPIVVPGWEDSTMGNWYAVQHVLGNIKHIHTVKSGMEYMTHLINWYANTARAQSIGFFQIGGGIAGDFPICVVPALRVSMERSDVPVWAYFCQISDSVTSYGSYSGAVPNEKITWGKLHPDTPRFVIESDATIVAPLVFALVLGT